MRLTPLLLLLPLGLGPGCGGHDHGHAAGSGGHHHEPLFGGALVELGDHYANLEIAYDAGAGSLTLWLLDGHAEKAVKGTQAEIPLEVVAGERRVALAATPAVSALAGNAVGSSSEFAVTSADLVGLERFELTVGEVEVLGSTFTDVRFTYPPEGE